MTATQTLDVRGTLCPEPVLRANRRLKAMATGERLLLVADDPAALIDIQHFCRQRRHELLEIGRDGAALTFLIARGGD